MTEVSPTPPIQSGTPAWADWCRELSQQRGYPICGRKNRQGSPCLKRCEAGRDCCRMHGGTKKVGLASPSYKHGRNSRYLLAGSLAEPYRRQAEDLEYASLRDELALVTALLEEQLLVLDRPLPEGTPEQLAAALRQREQAFRKLRELLQDRNRLVRTEVRRIQVAEDSLSGQQVRLFGQIVLESVRRRVAALVQRLGAPYELVLRTVGEVQDDVLYAMAASTNGSKEAGRDDLGYAEEL